MAASSNSPEILHRRLKLDLRQSPVRFGEVRCLAPRARPLDALPFVKHLGHLIADRHTEPAPTHALNHRVVAIRRLRLNEARRLHRQPAFPSQFHSKSAARKATGPHWHGSVFSDGVEFCLATGAASALPQHCHDCAMFCGEDWLGIWWCHVWSKGVFVLIVKQERPRSASDTSGTTAPQLRPDDAKAWIASTAPCQIGCRTC